MNDPKVQILEIPIFVKTHLDRLSTEDEEGLGTLLQEPCELVDQDYRNQLVGRSGPIIPRRRTVLNLICLLNSDGNSDTVYRGF